jgi:hypothetical protein
MSTYEALAVEDLLGDDGSQTTEKVAATIDDEVVVVLVIRHDGTSGRRGRGRYDRRRRPLAGGWRERKKEKRTPFFHTCIFPALALSAPGFIPDRSSGRD